MDRGLSPERCWLAQGHTLRLRFLEDGEPLAHSEVMTRWRSDPSFVALFETSLAETPFAAFFWETPAVDRTRWEQPFECVLIEARSLAGLRPDPVPFGTHLDPTQGEACAFENLGGDALLVAPTLGAGAAHCAHLADFLRGAPPAARAALWATLAERIEACVDDRPLWVSTSGLGVAWLHVRLDRRPKYYQHDPYRGA